MTSDSVQCHGQVGFILHGWATLWFPSTQHPLALQLIMIYTTLKPKKNLRVIQLAA